MVTVTIVNIIALCIAILGRLLKSEKAYFAIAIFVLFVFYSLRGDYGNDIPMYQIIFKDVSHYSFHDIWFNAEQHGLDKEMGWLLLNRLFAPLGWQPLLIFLTALQFGTIYWYIRKFVKPEYYWIILAFYIFNPNMMMVGLSMLRQELAMSVCLVAVYLTSEKKYLPSLALILLAYTFHTSAICMFVIFALPIAKHVDYRLIILALASIFLFIKFNNDFSKEIVSKILRIETFERYEIYREDDLFDGSGLGIILKIVFCLFLWFTSPRNKKTLYPLILFSIGILLLPFTMVIMLISRVTYYFDLSGLVAYQGALNTRHKAIGAALLLVMFTLNVLYYYNFFYDPIWRDAFMEYHTILE